MWWVALIATTLPSVMNALILARAQAIGGFYGWQTMLGQSLVLGNLLLAIGFYGLLGVYLFASEYSDRTWEHLMVMPISRTAVLAAKLVVFFGLTAVTALFGVLASTILGLTVLRLPGLELTLVWTTVQTAVTTTLLTSCLMTVTIWATMRVRNYIVPIAILIGLTVVNVSLVMFGADEAPYFPWSLPTIIAVARRQTQIVPPISHWAWALAGAVAVGGLALMWWHAHRADQGGGVA